MAGSQRALRAALCGEGVGGLNPSHRCIATYPETKCVIRSALALPEHEPFRQNGERDQGSDSRSTFISVEKRFAAHLCWRLSRLVRVQG